MTKGWLHPQRKTRASLHSIRNTDSRVEGGEEISGIVTRLREAANLPDTLAAGLGAFEATGSSPAAARTGSRLCSPRS